MLPLPHVHLASCIILGIEQSTGKQSVLLRTKCAKQSLPSRANLAEVALGLCVFPTGDCLERRW